MPLVLRPITTADTLSWTRIRAKAYLGPTHELIHSGPISEFSILKVAEGRKSEVGKPNHWQWKVVDTDLEPSPDDPDDNGGQTIAIAVWSRHNADPTRQNSPIEPTSLPAEKPESAEEEGPFIPPEIRLEVLDALFTPLRKAQSEIMGDRPYFMLNSFATHPDHHRKGAGTMLLNWGLKKADEEGLVTYLDTTTLARPIYEKHGFTVVTAIEFDRRPWGGEGMDWHGCMIRQPRPLPS
ncbi:hypothetical protein K505DRAFT_322482 [Melanomma pulvis-pyrius CBS 109.77]|uniref:N-acetyltransferase domain-containing protein n=1 Tax=Melanomma pulvis-pyrius CBS 109.77 TaxID=1314802 RepID=A0A6A6XPZ1_9PLEO|nr:hypothetical protein K505DRAFT_322482 [Melanomma pulvis-pyrius CBS 109.77]